MSVEPIPGIQIGPFLEKHGFRSVSISETQSGRNSRVLKVIGESREAILKAYHQSSGCLHDRLHAEYSFLTVLSSDPTIPVATPLGFDGKLALGLYEMLPGSAVTEVSEGDVNQASQFIEQINQLRETDAGKSLGEAAEACWTLDEHVRVVTGRVERLLKSLSRQTEPDAWDFVAKSLQPALQKVLATLAADDHDHPRLTGALSHCKILSPSDFGFHNALRDKDKLWFIDFEYAGWDDPVKLLCDFACQPEVPVCEEYARQFWQTLADRLRDEYLVDYAVKLLPLYRIKWCCILLNEFLTTGGDRRKHANPSDPGKKMLQLAKAKQYFSDHVVTG